MKDTTPEETHKPREILRKDASRVASLDTGSTFDSTNIESPLTQTMRAMHPIASRTNVGRKEMLHCGETPGLTEQMWLDEPSIIAIIGFTKLVDKCPL